MVLDPNNPLTTTEDRSRLWVLFGLLAAIIVVTLALSMRPARASIGDNEDRRQDVKYTYHKPTQKAPQKHKKPPVSLAKKRDVKPEKKPEVASADTSLVAKARSYIGTNPTGRQSLWCAAFMALIAPRAARRVKNPNWARDWAALPHVPAQVGAIVVLTRGKGGGHVGVVSGFKGENPIVISGNHNRVVGEGVYPKSRVIAYVAALEQVAMRQP